MLARKFTDWSGIIYCLTAQCFGNVVEINLFKLEINYMNYQLIHQTTNSSPLFFRINISLKYFLETIPLCCLNISFIVTWSCYLSIILITFLIINDADWSLHFSDLPFCLFMEKRVQHLFLNLSQMTSLISFHFTFTNSKKCHSVVPVNYNGNINAG